MSRRKYRDFEVFRSILVNDVWYWTKQQRKTHQEHLIYACAEVWNHPDLKRLTRYELGYLQGVNATIENEVSRGMDWKFPVNGEYLTWNEWREKYPNGNCAELKGQHLWPGTDKPW